MTISLPSSNNSGGTAKRTVLNNDPRFSVNWKAKASSRSEPTRNREEKNPFLVTTKPRGPLRVQEGLNRKGTTQEGVFWCRFAPRDRTEQSSMSCRCRFTPKGEGSSRKGCAAHFYNIIRLRWLRSVGFTVLSLSLVQLSGLVLQQRKKEPELFYWEDNFHPAFQFN